VVRAAGVSEVGRVRKSNEDRFVVDPALRLFAVADGMGGHRAGEVASQLAIDDVTAFIRLTGKDTDVTWPYGILPELSFDGNRLRTAISLANQHVFATAEGREEYRGMGTTLAALLVNDSQVALASVGDSRIYLLSNGALEQLTTDDSWAATLLAQDSTLHPDDIAQHPMRNVLTSVIGVRENINVRMIERTLAAGDVLLLSTDGLHGVLTPELIQRLLRDASEIEGAARALVDAALDHGTRDNVTAVVLRYEQD
jgi:serine/threonine protein phosphatase PrpC